MKEWIKKIGQYAPDIAAAVATGGGSLAATGLRILGQELLGRESASENDIERAVSNASPDKLVELQKANNQFKVEMASINAEERKHEHQTTQETIRNGDNSDSKVVRLTRPAQSWVSLFAAIYYGLATESPSFEILALLMTLPLAYAGLRQVGKWKTASSLVDIGRK